MLTGIELTLAIAPLVIAGTEPYRILFNKARTLSNRRIKKDQQLDFLRDLGIEVSLLQFTLINLVSDLPDLSITQKQQLLEYKELESDKTVSLWESDAVQQAIERRLSGCDQAFTECLQVLLKSLDGLISDKSAGLQGIDLGQLESSGIYAKLVALRKDRSRDSFKDRFQFTRNERSRLHGLKRITEANAKLQKLLSQAAKASGNVKRMIRSRDVPRKGHRRLINSLYAAMASCWTCNCDPPHEARVCLSQREAEKSDGHKTGAIVASLDMLISVHGELETQGNWQESNVSIVAEEMNEQSPSITVVNTGTAEGSTRQQVKALGGLCNLVSDKRARQMSLGIEYDASSGGLWSGRPRRRLSTSGKGTNLKQLLDLPGKELSLKDRRRLAVMIAHAVLHFSEGPWLDKDWDKQHISFFPHEPQPPSGTTVDLGRPYLSTKFRNGDGNEALIDRVDSFTFHQSPTILALGVLLLELDMCGPIESYYDEADLADGIENPNTKLTTAERLLSDSVDEMYERYHAAIKECLDCDWVFDQNGMLNDDSFREELYHRVVAPLEDELRTGWSIKPEHLALVFQK